MTFTNRFFFFLLKKTRAKNELSTDFRKTPLCVFLNVFNLFFGGCEVNKINNFQT